MASSIESLKRQLTAFARFTTQSLADSNLECLMLNACVRARAGVDVSHAKLLEYLPGRDRMLLRAGIGWKEGLVGQYEVPPALDTPIGHAYNLAEAVAIEDYTRETKYQYPQILKDHGCVASLNVPLQTDSGMFGVLEVDHVAARQFSNDDISFLTGLGNTVAQAVKLKRALSAAEAALDDKQLLLREMNHRIKNNLGLVSAILSLQSKRFKDATVREEFTAAANRIRNLALVHDRLQLFSTSASEVAAEPHFRDLGEMLRSLLPPGVGLTITCSGTIWGDCVEALTLITNELVTNAAKYAFAGRETGEISIGYREEGAGWRMWVSDNGTGFTASTASSSFGQQMIAAMATRLHAEIAYSVDNGTRVEVVCGAPFDFR
jgi:two-component sensor histidine kinase